MEMAFNPGKGRIMEGFLMDQFQKTGILILRSAVYPATVDGS
jgi:hypothetical protein